MGDGFALVENIVKSEQDVYIITESTDTNSHTTCIPVSHHSWVHTMSVDWKWGYVNCYIKHKCLLYPDGDGDIAIPLLHYAV